MYPKACSVRSRILVIAGVIFFLSFEMRPAWAGMLTISDRDEQMIKGWGFTPGPLDWDGRCVLRDKGLLNKLYHESGATIARFLIAPVTLSARNRTLDEWRSNNILTPQISSLHENGLDHYILTLVGPPAVMRKNYSDEAYVDLDPNFLRTEMEDEYSVFITSIVSFIRKQNMVLPVAISLQNQPDYPLPPYFGGTVLSGCIYTPEQLDRLAKKLRTALDAAEFKNVGIIGPETLGHKWVNDAWHQTGMQNEGPPAFCFFSGLAIHSSGTLVSEDKPSSVEFYDILMSARRDHRDIWITDVATPSATNDEEVLIGAFSALRRDLSEAHASYWFWRYGFTWDSGSEGLLHGKAGKEAPIYWALRELWKEAPPGSHFREILTDGSTMAQSASLHAFCISTPEHTVIALFNPAETTESFDFKVAKSIDGQFSLFRAQYTPEKKSICPTNGIFHAEVPRKAVAVIVIQNDRQP